MTNQCHRLLIGPIAKHIDQSVTSPINRPYCQTRDQSVPSSISRPYCQTRDKSMPSPRIYCQIHDQSVPSPINRPYHQTHDQSMPSPRPYCQTHDQCHRLGPIAKHQIDLERRYSVGSQFASPSEPGQSQVINIVAKTCYNPRGSPRHLEAIQRQAEARERLDKKRQKGITATRYACKSGKRLHLVQPGKPRNTQKKKRKQNPPQNPPLESMQSMSRENAKK